jgi:hypothetical protein
MAGATSSWFDKEKLLPGETMVLDAPVRLRTPSPPGWWEGTLVLTSDRIFFLPYVHNPLTRPIAFWLADIEELPAGRNRLRIRKTATGNPSATFQFLGPRLGPRGILGERGKIWLYQVRRARRHARPSYAFDVPAPTVAFPQQTSAAG